MNDFTKEELEYLRYCVVTDIDIQNYHLDSKPNMIASKIQSMIDNYCDNKYKLLDYVSDKVIEKHKTCLKNQFDNGYFWAMKELQEMLLKNENTNA